MSANSLYYTRIIEVCEILDVTIYQLRTVINIDIYKYKRRQTALTGSVLDAFQDVLSISSDFLNTGTRPIFLFDAPHKLEGHFNKNFDYLFSEEGMVEHSDYAGLLKVMHVIRKNIGSMNTVLKVDLRELRKQKEFPDDVLNRCEELLGINPQYIRNGFGEMFTPDARQKLWNIFKEDIKLKLDKEKEPAKASTNDILALRKKVLNFVPLANNDADELNAILNKRKEIESRIIEDVKAYFELLNNQLNNEIF